MKILVVVSNKNYFKVNRILDYKSNNEYDYFKLYNSNSRLNKNMYSYDAVIIAIDKETLKDMNDFNSIFLCEFVKKYDKKKVTIIFDELDLEPEWVANTLVIGCNSG